MKKFALTLIGILIIVIVIVNWGNKPSPEPVPPSVSFETESNPDYLGSYTIERSNQGQTWDEWGEWRSGLEMFFDKPKVCFGSYHGGRAIFRAKPGYTWNITVNEGRTCLLLQKNP